MLKKLPAPRLLLLASTLSTSAIAIAASVEADVEKAITELEDHWSLLESYCMDRHNFEDFSGGIDLSFFSPSNVVEESETFETPTPLHVSLQSK